VNVYKVVQKHEEKRPRHIEKDNIKIDLKEIGGFGLDWTGQGFNSCQQLAIFLFATASRPALWPTQPPIPWVQGALPTGVKWPQYGVHHSPPSSTIFQNA
jgi:hypothetical protein